MLLIGIDEAGYGPKLGPLCHGYSAIRLAWNSLAAPDLWTLLHPSVTRYPGYEQSITVDDSKKVYSSAQGINGLIKAISAFVECTEGAVARQAESLYERLLPASDRAALEEDEWGRASAEVVPASGEPAPTSKSRRKKKTPPAAPAPEHIPPLRETLDRKGITVMAIGARSLSARHYNLALSNGNKADLNWQTIAAQLSKLVEMAAPGEDVFAVIDRQGGRKFYTAQLAELFPGALPWVETETPDASVYRIETERRTVRVAFLVDGDGLSMPVALGSMAAKLARELCMQRLNAFFRSHDPQLRPTAGYYGDANRFLRETHSLRQKLGIADGALVRVK